MILKKTYKPEEGEEKLVMQLEEEVPENLEKPMNEVRDEQENSLFNKKPEEGNVGNMDVNVNCNDEVPNIENDVEEADNKDVEVPNKDTLVEE